jgi:hypothetical protein
MRRLRKTPCGHSFARLTAELSVRQMFEATGLPLRGLTIAQDSARTSPMKPSQSKDPDSRANPLIGKVQQYDAMENPLAKNCKLLPREPSALLDFKGHTDVMRPLTCW